MLGHLCTHPGPEGSTRSRQLTLGQGAPTCLACVWPGVMLNMLALILMGTSVAHVFNALAPASVILGLAGITFHLSQLHVASLFPRRKGLVASLLVAGFTGCGIIFYIMQEMNKFPRCCVLLSPWSTALLELQDQEHRCHPCD